MQAYEMNNKATEGLAKKLAVYREANPLQEPPVAKTHDFDTYEDAKNAKDVQGMLKHKLGNYRKRVVNLSNALYVNDGHVQHKRFLPAERLSANGKSVYLKKKDQKGIMLSERYIEGKFF